MQQVTWKDVGRKENKILSPAYKSNGQVFTSGNVGNDENGAFPGEIEEQTVLAIENLEKTLKASNSGLDKVLKVLLFISNGDDFGKVNEIYHKYFPHCPARSCVVVQFPNQQIKVELECVAEEN
ncbi:protein Mmf1p, mitochondrial [Diutina catenulata]